MHTVNWSLPLRRVACPLTGSVRFPCGIASARLALGGDAFSPRTSASVASQRAVMRNAG